MQGHLMRSRVLRSKRAPNVAHTTSGQGPLLKAALNTGQKMGFAVGLNQIAARVPTLPLSGFSFVGLPFQRDTGRTPGLSQTVASCLRSTVTLRHQSSSVAQTRKLNSGPGET